MRVADNEPKAKQHIYIYIKKAINHQLHKHVLYTIYTPIKPEHGQIALITQLHVASDG